MEYPRINHGQLYETVNGCVKHDLEQITRENADVLVELLERFLLHIDRPPLADGTNALHTLTSNTLLAELYDIQPDLRVISAMKRMGVLFGGLFSRLEKDTLRAFDQSTDQFEYGEIEEDAVITPGVTQIRVIRSGICVPNQLRYNRYDLALSAIVVGPSDREILDNFNSIRYTNFS